jgi:hypothetical protein
VGEFGADTRDRLEQLFRAGGSLEVIKESPPATGEHLGDRTGDRGANAGDRLERCAPSLVGDGPEIVV